MLIVCPVCGTEHDRSALPPSVQKRVAKCLNCYNEMKKVAHARWRAKNRAYLVQVNRDYRYNKKIKEA